MGRDYLDSKSFVEILSLIRHDYLNHLQVISGLIQLGKAEQAREYIKRVCSDTEKISKISRLTVPEIAEFLIMAHYIGERNQINVVYDIGNDVDHCVIPRDILAYILKELLELTLEYMAHSASTEKVLKICLDKPDDILNIRFIFNGLVEKNAKEKISQLNNKLLSFGGEISLNQQGDGSHHISLNVL